MQVYQHVPYVRIVFYVFTIGFHFFLLIRALLNAKYILAAVLLIPVTAISVALLRFTRHAVLRARVTTSGLELDTFFRTKTFRPEEITIKGKRIETAEGRKFIFKPSQGKELTEKLNQLKRHKSGY